MFQKPFRLVQEVLLEGNAAGAGGLQGKEALTMTGTIDYQACDDKVCFNPTSRPGLVDAVAEAPDPERPTAPR